MSDLYRVSLVDRKSRFRNFCDSNSSSLVITGGTMHSSAPNKYNMPNRHRSDVDITSIRRQENMEKISTSFRRTFSE